MSYSITTGTTTTNILSTIATNLSTALTNFLETIHVWTAKQTFPASSEISGTISASENSAVISTTAWVKNKIESYLYQTASNVNSIIESYSYQTAGNVNSIINNLTIKTIEAYSVFPITFSISSLSSGIYIGAISIDGNWGVGPFADFSTDFAVFHFVVYGNDGSTHKYMINNITSIGGEGVSITGSDIKYAPNDGGKDDSFKYVFRYKKII